LKKGLAMQEKEEEKRGLGRKEIEGCLTPQGNAIGCRKRWCKRNEGTLHRQADNKKSAGKKEGTHGRARQGRKGGVGKIGNVSQGEGSRGRVKNKEAGKGKYPTRGEHCSLLASVHSEDTLSSFREERKVISGL